MTNNDRRTPSFGRAGRPRKIDFSDLFLWSPQVEMELQGISLSRVFGEQHAEMLALFQDIGRKRKISRDRTVKALDPVLKLMTNCGYPWTDDFKVALQGDESKLSRIGLWQSYIHGISIQPDGTWPSEFSPIGRHFVDIEQALIEPTQAWHQNDMAKCADLLESSEVLALYLWPEVISRFRRATTKEETTVARIMVMLEIYLSCLACWDAQVQAKGHTKQILFESLFPDFSAERIEHPNALFFNWLADYPDVNRKLGDYLVSISKPADETDIESTKRQLRRWKRGNGFASEDMLDALFRKLHGDRAGQSDNDRHRDWIVSWSMAMATRRISFLMSILLLLRTCRDPLFPFGHQTVQEWRANRYPHWYKHWLSLLKGK